MKTLLLLAALASSAPPPAEGPFAELGFEEACQKAKESKRVVMIDFFTTWCGPCKKLDAVTWKDASVIEWLDEHTIALKIDAEKEVELAKRFKVDSYPTMIFAESNGDLKGRVVGYKEPTEFLSAAADVLAGISPSDRLREQLVEDADNPSLKMDLAQELKREGAYEEALELLLWCWDHGVDDPKSGFGGVRISYLVTELGGLLGVYPAARAPLVERRDRAQQATLSEQANSLDAREFIALTKAVGEPDRVLTVYESVLAHQTEAQKKGAPVDLRLREILFEEVVPSLLKAKRYADLLDGFGDPEQWFDKKLGETEHLLKLMKDDSFSSYLRGSFLTEANQVYQSLLGTREHDARAARLAERVLAFDPSVNTWNALMTTARRTGRADTQALLRAQALEALPEEEHRKLNKVRKPIKLRKEGGGL